MDVLIAKDHYGRLVCTLCPRGRAAVVTASDPAAAAGSLLDALDEVQQTGYAECFWPEPNGEYRWMFRRAGDTLTVVVLWSIGTLTGWDHVVDAETDFAGFASQVRGGLAAIGAAEGA